MNSTSTQLALELYALVAEIKALRLHLTWTSTGNIPTTPRDSKSRWCLSPAAAHVRGRRKCTYTPVEGCRDLPPPVYSEPPFSRETLEGTRGTAHVAFCWPISSQDYRRQPIIKAPENCVFSDAAGSGNTSREKALAKKDLTCSIYQSRLYIQEREAVWLLFFAFVCPRTPILFPSTVLRNFGASSRSWWTPIKTWHFQKMGSSTNFIDGSASPFGWNTTYRSFCDPHPCFSHVSLLEVGHVCLLWFGGFKKVEAYSRSLEDAHFQYKWHEGWLLNSRPIRRFSED